MRESKKAEKDMDRNELYIIYVYVYFIIIFVSIFKVFMFSFHMFSLTITPCLQHRYLFVFIPDLYIATPTVDSHHPLSYNNRPFRWFDRSLSIHKCVNVCENVPCNENICLPKAVPKRRRRLSRRSESKYCLENIIHLCTIPHPALLFNIYKKSILKLCQSQNSNFY